jgi:ADP-heptose:LPS heptosyltransferase
MSNDSASFYVEGVRKIAILRANALGDFIVTLPAIHAIRDVYPNAEIILLGKPWHKDYLKGNRTPVDRVIVIPISDGLREEPGQYPVAGELEDFYLQTAKEKFDIAIHFHGKGISANPFINRLGAKLTVGLTCPEAMSLDRQLNFFYYQSEVLRYLEVASLIGAVAKKLEPSISILPEDKEEILDYFDNSDYRPFIVLHPCGTDRRRMWNENKFSELADFLSGKNYRILFTGSSQDSDAVSSIIDCMNYPAENVCGKFSLGGLGALFAKSELVIGIDTGPLHLARAVGVKTIGLYWAPNVINWGPLSRSKHRPVISWKMECPLCGIIPNDPFPYEPSGTGCSHMFSSISGISVDQVIKELVFLLNIDL